MDKSQENTAAFESDVYLYVNKLLAQGGTVYITKDNLVFKPTGFLDKALGAKDVTISLSGITKATVQGVIVKNLLVIDGDQVYKFIGSDLEEFLKALDKAMRKSEVKEI